MTTTTTHTETGFDGTYVADAIHSRFGFAVVHNGISTFRGSLDDVDATLTADGGDLQLEGTAKVESISIREPVEFRAHVLAEDFFDAANHPDVRFTSTSIVLGDDGAVSVEGELSIAGKTKEVAGTGTYQAPRESLGGKRAALELETTFDRRDFGFDWQMETPGGALALAWDVTLEIHLELVKSEEA